MSATFFIEIGSILATTERRGTAITCGQPGGAFTVTGAAAEAPEDHSRDASAMIRIERKGWTATSRRMCIEGACQSAAFGASISPSVATRKWTRPFSVLLWSHAYAHNTAHGG